MNTLGQIREAERMGETLRLAHLLVRAGFVKKEGADCIHCKQPMVGYGVWGDNLAAETWEELNDIGLPYRCRWAVDDYSGSPEDESKGCGGLYVIQYKGGV